VGKAVDVGSGVELGTSVAVEKGVYVG